MAPVPIEAALTASPLIGQAVVVGDSRPCLMALLVPDEDVWPVWAAARGLEPELPKTPCLPSSHPLHAAAAAAIALVNEPLPRYAQIKDFAVLSTPFSVDSGELTPTLKLRRNAISQARAGVVDALYGDG